MDAAGNARPWKGALMEIGRTRPQTAPRLSKGMYILPSLFTTANWRRATTPFLGDAGDRHDFRHLDFAAKAIGFAFLLTASTAASRA